jgi:hypothetical protein
LWFVWKITTLAGVDAYSLPGFDTMCFCVRWSFCFHVLPWWRNSSFRRNFANITIVRVTRASNLIPLYYEVNELSSLSQDKTITVISCIRKQNVFGGHLLKTCQSNFLHRMFLF